MNITKAKQIEGWMHDSELFWLAETSKDKTIICEIGSWKGRSSKAIADNMPENATLWCIDTWKGSLNERETTQKEADDLYGDGVYYDFLQSNIEEIQKGRVIPLRMKSINASNFFRENKITFDFIFIDGSHDFLSIQQDIAFWWPLLKDHGVFSGHDYVFTTVCDAVNEYFNPQLIELIDNTSIWTIKN